jgi:hypothetical protein
MVVFIFGLGVPEFPSGAVVFSWPCVEVLGDMFCAATSDSECRSSTAGVDLEDVDDVVWKRKSDVELELSVDGASKSGAVGDLAVVGSAVDGEDEARPTARVRLCR